MRFTILIACLVLSLPVGAVTPTGSDDLALAQSIAEMLRDARTVISQKQGLINDPNLGDKHLTGEAVLNQAIEIYTKATGEDPEKINPATRRARLLRGLTTARVV